MRWEAGEPIAPGVGGEQAGVVKNGSVAVTNSSVGWKPKSAQDDGMACEGCAVQAIVLF
jgi:hypothetical protein